MSDPMPTSRRTIPLTAVAPAPHPADVRERRRRDTYRLLWRWHFYAGLLCVPFLLWLATTGAIYLFKPQIEPILERRYAQVATPDEVRAAPSRIAAAALAAVPGSRLTAVVLPDTPTEAIRVLVGRGPAVTRVFVHPGSARVMGQVDETDRFMRIVFYLHGELLLGRTGSMLVELAACWTIVMLLTGLYLWWPRSGGLGGVVYPRLRSGRRLLWRDLHAVTGVWLSVFTLLLIVSGLPWTQSWGGMLKDARDWHAGRTLVQDWTTGREQANAPAAAHHGDASRQDSGVAAPATRTAAPPALGDTPGMTGMDGMEGMEGMDGMAHAVEPMEPSPAGSPYAALDVVLPAAAALHLQPPVLVSPPAAGSTGWTARSDTQDRPLRAKAVLDPTTGAVQSRDSFADAALLDRIIGYGVAAHEGQLFGPLNQLLGLATALGLIASCVSAFVLWWRRRPTGLLGAPKAEGARFAGWMLALLVALAVVLPLLGASLLLVLLLEWAVFRRHAGTAAFLGLR